MKTRNKRTLLDTREKNLIKSSSICDSDLELKDVLSIFSKSINLLNIEKIKLNHPRIYNMLKTNEAIKEMIDNSSLEWKQSSPIGVKKIPCQLCENTKSENKYIIKNIVNQNELEVGSSCITKFPKMDKTYSGENITLINKWIKNSPEKLERLSKFAQRYGGGKDILNKWNDSYRNFKMEFPNDYDKEFSEIIKKGRKIYNEYINGILSINEINKFQECINDFDYLYKKCKSFEMDNKNNKYICTKSIARLLEKNELISTKNTIKEMNCTIRKEFAKYIYDVDFIRNFEQKIRDMFKNNNMILEEINNKVILVKYEYNNSNEVILEISLKNFSNKYYSLYYNEIDFKKEELFSNLNLTYEMKNIEKFISILNKILNDSTYYLKFNIDLYNQNNVEIHNRSLKRFASINTKELINKFFNCLYLADKQSEKFIINQIDNIEKWTTYKEREKYDVGDISSKWTI